VSRSRKHFYILPPQSRPHRCYHARKPPFPAGIPLRPGMSYPNDSQSRQQIHAAAVSSLRLQIQDFRSDAFRPLSSNGSLHRGIPTLYRRQACNISPLVGIRRICIEKRYYFRPPQEEPPFSESADRYAEYPAHSPVLRQ